MTPEQVAAELTSIYRTPTGTMALNTVQGQVLMGAATGGAFSNQSVGMGKTLTLAIAIAIIGGQRPLILTEACNIPTFQAELAKYRRHFNFPSNYRLESYETISNHPELLDTVRPTMLGLDEAQRVKSAKESARGARMDRWRVANPDVPMVVLSGSPGEHFPDYAHLMVWGVPKLASTRGGPIPVDADGRPAGPEFRRLCKRLREDDSFHKEFWDRVKAFDGVVVSSEAYNGVPLIIHHVVMPTPPEMEAHWQQLREYGEAPDDWLLEDGPAEQWALARIFAGAGCYYEHVPRPPDPFRHARKAYSGFVSTIRDLAERAPGGPYDTPGQVGEACALGALPADVWRAWMVQKPSYNPTTTTTWLSSGPLDYARRWGAEQGARVRRRAGGISGGAVIWTEHTGFGKRLAQLTGWPYYGEEARCAPGPGGLVQNASAPVIICSTDSCGTGKNLQHRYSRALWMNPPSNMIAAEQQIGREHRPGQVEDQVECWFAYGCLEDWAGVRKALAAAHEAQDDLTAPRKLLLAQHNWARYPEGDAAGFAWRKADKTVVVRI